MTEALAAQREVVASRPDDAAERLFLCELLAFAGDRDGSRAQLAAIAPSGPEMSDYLATWRDLLKADDRRHAGQPPEFLQEPPSVIGQRLASLADPDDESSLDVLGEGDERASWIEGHVDGREFVGWRDADDALGPILEVFHGEAYLWVPLEQVRKLRLAPIEVPRDAIYRPASLWLDDGSQWDLFLPALYVETSGHEEDGVRIGAGVDWIERAGMMRGLGMRTFLFGEEELAIDEWTQVEVQK